MKILTVKIFYSVKKRDVDNIKTYGTFVCSPSSERISKCNILVSDLNKGVKLSD